MSFLSVDVTVVLAVEINQVARTVRSPFDSGVIPGDLRIVELDFRAARAADVKVGPRDLEDTNNLTVTDQFKCRNDWLGFEILGPFIG